MVDDVFRDVVVFGVLVSWDLISNEMVEVKGFGNLEGCFFFYMNSVFVIFGDFKDFDFVFMFVFEFFGGFFGSLEGI